MRKRFIFLLLCALMLSGCGAVKRELEEVRLPYLTAEERAELEQGLVDSLRLEWNDGTGTNSSSYCIIEELENTSDYELYDISVSYSLSGEQVLWLGGLPPHTAFGHTLGLYAGSGEKMRAKAEEMEYRYDISYTIGAFNYLISDCRIPPKEKEGEHEIIIELKTDQGSVFLHVPGLDPMTFEGAVEGIRTGAILSVSEGDNADFYHEYSETAGTIRSLYLKFTGKNPDDEDDRIIYRLIDDDGIIRSSGIMWFWEDGTRDLYSGPLEPGHYTLEFTELKVYGDEG